ncbi:GTP-binding protein HSR1 [candidate division bacterium WOR-3 4484_18]|uniref:GTP-binding protein HSR1 n=1 Tax=candidate division WOR-3 bacterium 4484_18 TaxID=2020626 RepID=A0A257LU01_UNCW3|nr:MAG: GTP-binding protein HSR1 [candidate division bacterium WOR-3 4484_18]
MPANLPPQYFAAEKRYREAKTPEDKIKALEEMLAIMPKHKGTDKLQAALRAKIAKFRRIIILVGAPNSGKSLLMRRLTNTDTKVAPYPFTTTGPVVGMMEFEDIKIQLVDLPPLTKSPIPGLFGIIHDSDALLWIHDVTDPNPIRIETEKQQLLARKPPAKILAVINKIDLVNPPSLDRWRSLLHDFKLHFISAETLQGLEELRRMIFDILNVIRVYTKAPGKPIEYSDPLILPKCSTLLDAAEEIHKDFAHKLKYARLWRGTSIKGLRVEKNYKLEDRDVVEFHIK